MFNPKARNDVLSSTLIINKHTPLYVGSEIAFAEQMVFVCTIYHID